MMGFGETGVGKSCAGNRLVKIKDAFTVGSTPDSETFETTSYSNVINGIKRVYIDTQGLKSSDGKDALYIQQMIEYLKKWKHGINAFYLFLNIQNPRFDKSVQTMLEIMNDFFNNPAFWNQTGIVFTKCYRVGGEKLFDEEMAKTQYRQKVVDFICKLPGCENIHPQMPCFFIDSKRYDADEDTRNEFIRIFEFAHRQRPVSTQKMVIASPDYKKKEKEILSNVLVRYSYDGEGEQKTKILYYENQIRYKITYRNGDVSFTKPKAIKSWTEVIKTKVKYETKIEQNRSSKSIYQTRTEDGSIIRMILNVYLLGLLGTGSKTVVEYVHDKVTTSFIEYIRKIVTDPDGNVDIGEWKINKKWSKVTYEYNQ